MTSYIVNGYFDELKKRAVFQLNGGDRTDEVNFFIIEFGNSLKTHLVIGVESLRILHRPWNIAFFVEDLCT